jgi:hypothetical protein
MPPSKAIPMRSGLLRDYIREYMQRWPEDRVYAEGLYRSVNRSHVVGLLYGWIAAENDAEAEECLMGLRTTPAGRRLAPALRVLARLGMSTRRRATLAPFIRRIGRVIPA